VGTSQWGNCAVRPRCQTAFLRGIKTNEARGMSTGSSGVATEATTYLQGHRGIVTELQAVMIACVGKVYSTSR
jgi:hypothetical protein